MTKLGNKFHTVTLESGHRPDLIYDWHNSFFIRLQAAAHLELWNRVVYSQRMWNATTGCLVW
jgi:hypothetical protein